MGRELGTSCHLGLPSLCFGEVGWLLFLLPPPCWKRLGITEVPPPSDELKASEGPGLTNPQAPWSPMAPDWDLQFGIIGLVVWELLGLTGYPWGTAVVEGLLASLLGTADTCLPRALCGQDGKEA